jgi:hypothetical protein
MVTRFFLLKIASLERNLARNDNFISEFTRYL